VSGVVQAVVRTSAEAVEGAHRQPMDGRQQRHAHGRPSMLGVFRKAAP
jgi:hypothetical protein